VVISAPLLVREAAFSSHAGARVTAGVGCVLSNTVDPRCDPVLTHVRKYEYCESATTRVSFARVETSALLLDAFAVAARRAGRAWIDRGVARVSVAVAVQLLLAGGAHL